MSVRISILSLILICCSILVKAQWPNLQSNYGAYPVQQYQNPNQNSLNSNSSNSINNIPNQRSITGKSSSKANDSLSFRAKSSPSNGSNGLQGYELDTKLSTEDSLNKIIQRKTFGYSIFNSEKLSFEPNLKIATPKNYILGPEDQIIIDINGYSEEHYTLNVTPDGFVRINKVGNVYVAGLSIEEAKARIIKKLSSIYLGLKNAGTGSSPTNLYATISLGNIRTVSVTVQGEVNLPGTYSVPSLARIMNVLYLAGGPSVNGTYRDIKLIRAGKVVASLDVYDYLLSGTSKNDLTVQDQDVILVGVYQNRIELNGKFKRPMIFEVLPNEKLSQVIEQFGGGFKDEAYKGNVKITRFTDKERKILDVSSDLFSSLSPQSGDIIEADGIDLERFENRITIEGEVWRPGDFSLESTPTLKDLIAKAGGFKDAAFLGRILITRLNPDLTTQIATVNFQQLLKEGKNFPLKREDKVQVFSTFKLLENYQVTIHGEINAKNKPVLDNEMDEAKTSTAIRSGSETKVEKANENFELNSEIDQKSKSEEVQNALINRQLKMSFPYSEGMTVEDLILLAGGLRESAKSGLVEVVRRKRTASEQFNPQDNSISEIINFSISKDLSLDEKASSFKLQPFDEVFIRSSSNYQVQQFVTLKGQIAYPGVYGLEKKDERISSLIMRAGGTTSVGYLKGAKVIRRFTMSPLEKNIENKRLMDLQDNYVNSSVKAAGNNSESYQEPIGVNLESALQSPNGIDDIILQDGDVIDIPILPQTVKISGEVLQATNIKYVPNASFRFYISSAGGFTGASWRKRAYVIYPNGSIKRTRNFLFLKFNPQIERGAEIIVPTKKKGQGNFQQLASVIGIFTGTVTSIIGLVTLIKATQQN